MNAIHRVEEPILLRRNPVGRTIRLLRLLLSAVAAIWLLAQGHDALAAEVKIQHNGLTLNARLSEAEGGRLKDGVILVLHGTLGHNAMDTIQNLTGILAERGLASLAINLSLGVSDRRGPYDCKITSRHRHLDALDEIGAWLAWLQTKGAGDVILLGHSRGGNQAARFMAEKGHVLVKRLILMAPSTWEAERARHAFKARHGRPLAGVLAKAEALIKAGRGGGVLANAGVLFCPGADVTAASFASYYRPDPRQDTPGILAEIKVPTLVIAAGNDVNVRGLEEKVKPRADGGKLHFALVEGAGHFFLDLYAEDVADLIEAFMAAGK